MKNILLIILTIISINTQNLAQNNKFTNKITYLETINLGDGNFENNYNLYFNNDIAFYQEQYGTKDKEIENESDGSTKITLFANESNARYYLTFLKNNKILFGENIAFEYYHVEENVPDIKWKLIDETKTIGKFQCKTHNPEVLPLPLVS